MMVKGSSHLSACVIQVTADHQLVSVHIISSEFISVGLVFSILVCVLNMELKVQVSVIYLFSCHPMKLHICTICDQNEGIWCMKQEAFFFFESKRNCWSLGLVMLW